MNRFKAVLFDIDGTLVDSIESVLRSFEYAAKACSLPPSPRHEIQPLLSMPLARIFARLYSDGNTEDLLSSYRSYQHEHMALNSEIEGARALLTALKDNGLLLAALSNRTSHTLSALLRQTGLYDFFDVVIPSDHVVNPKPDPEIIFKACEILAVTPKDCVMIGDAPSDVLAGIAAGTRTIAVLVGIHEEASFADHAPDYIVKTLADIPSIIRTRYAI